MTAGQVEDDGLPSTFAGALRKAIAVRGLPLVRVQDRLTERGFSMSVATLSYWQSGRSQPERAASLRALAALEEILDLGPGTLRRRLDAPRPRGRLRSVGMDPDEIMTGWEELHRQANENLAQIRRLSIHLLAQVAADHTAVIAARAVCRVHGDSTDRVSVFIGQVNRSDRVPEVVPRLGCTLGAVHTSPEGDAVIAELMLPEALSRGTTFALEYDLVSHEPESTSNTLFEVYRTAQTVLAVSFHPDAVPESVQLSEGPNAEHQTRTVVALRADHTVQIIRQDFGPGRIGLDWQW